MLKNKLALLVITMLIASGFVQAQDELLKLNYSEPEKFEIAEITVSGSQFLDPTSLISVSGLKVGDVIKIP